MTATCDLRTEENAPELPPRAEPLLSPLLEVLQAVNRIRIEYGADPIYELPKAASAWELRSTCVLQRAFADLGVAVVDYDRAYGKDVSIKHGPPTSSGTSTPASIRSCSSVHRRSG